MEEKLELSLAQKQLNPGVLFQLQKKAVILWNAFCIFKILKFSTEVKQNKRILLQSVVLMFFPYTWLMLKATEQALKHSFDEQTA